MLWVMIISFLNSVAPPICPSELPTYLFTTLEAQNPAHAFRNCRKIADLKISRLWNCERIDREALVVVQQADRQHMPTWFFVIQKKALQLVWGHLVNSSFFCGWYVFYWDLYRSAKASQHLDLDHKELLKGIIHSNGNFFLWEKCPPFFSEYYMNIFMVSFYCMQGCVCAFICTCILNTSKRRGEKYKLYQGLHLFASLCPVSDRTFCNFKASKSLGRWCYVAQKRW